MMMKILYIYKTNTRANQCEVDIPIGRSPILKNTPIPENEKKTSDQVIWKFKIDFPVSSTPLTFSFSKIHMMNGTKIPKIGKAINNSWERFNIVNTFLSSFVFQLISSSGDDPKAIASLLKESPLGTVSPFSILWIVRKLSPDSEASWFCEKPTLWRYSFILSAIFSSSIVLIRMEHKNRVFGKQESQVWVDFLTAIQWQACQRVCRHLCSEAWYFKCVTSIFSRLWPDQSIKLVNFMQG